MWRVRWNLWKSRSTWACELKCISLTSCYWDMPVTLHVSVWVEITETEETPTEEERHAPRERVSWNPAIILNSVRHFSHAPRERVSWNFFKSRFSVFVWMSRSTWACELKSLVNAVFHVLKSHAPRERVSWNICVVYMCFCQNRHAPRERVSWNHLCNM